MFLPHPCVKVSIMGSLRDREVACSASDRQGLNFESCVWRTVSSQSSHHPQEVLLAQVSLYVHKGGLKPDSFHFHFIYMIHLYGLAWFDARKYYQHLNTPRHKCRSSKHNCRNQADVILSFLSLEKLRVILTCPRKIKES